MTNPNKKAFALDTKILYISSVDSYTFFIRLCSGAKYGGGKVSKNNWAQLVINYLTEVYNWDNKRFF